MVKNKFSSFIIEKSFQILINIDSNFFNKDKLMKNNNINFNSNDSSDSKEDDDEKEDEKQIDNDICVINIKNGSKNNNEIMNYDTFIELKNKIFYIFDNNTSNKEKEKIINLLKQNYNYESFVNNKAINGKTKK